MKLLKLLFLFLLINQYISSRCFAVQDTLLVKSKEHLVTDIFAKIFSKYQVNQLIRNELTELSTLNNQALFFQKPSNELKKIYLITFDSKIPKDKIIFLLKQTGNFEYVEEYPERHLSLIPNDSLYSEQYYMKVLNVTQAWDSIKIKSKVIVGVVDTGVDYEHPDLKNNIFQNSGELGLDSNNVDKKSNGIDDDGNGFIDDWHGWDFIGDSLGQDNDPFPGHGHGTHVSGTIAAEINNTIGIAGMCDSLIILPLKCGSDNPLSTSLQNSFEAILYAAKMGAKVINCSWGGTSRSQTEQEVIDAVIKLGTNVVAAAGNSNEDAAFYPASYEGVISVAATDSADVKTFFSNYNSNVDVSAPGINIMSTLPWNSYASWMGTSMASPVVAGIAAMLKMVHPEYNPLQLGEHLKATTTDINTGNPLYVGKLGRGRVDALKAVTEQYPKSILIKKISIEEEFADRRYLSDEKCFISFELENLLTDLKNMSILIRTTDNSKIQFSPSVIKYGELKQNSIAKLLKASEFIIPQYESYDNQLEIEFIFFEGAEILNQKAMSINVNPSYLNFENNDISTTFNSCGNIGFNDYPQNEQGIGFSYKNSPNLLYEGSVMISIDSLLADVARSGNQSYQNNGLTMRRKLEYLPIMNPTLLAGSAAFGENELLAKPMGLKVEHLIHQQKMPSNVIYSIYDIVNTNDYSMDSVYLGLYFDWDIGISGTDNITLWVGGMNCALIQNSLIDSLPKIAVKMLSNHPHNFWAIDNDGTTYENPGVWDGFTDKEKIRMLKSGIGRDLSGITDVSAVISAGPIFMSAKDTSRVSFAIVSDRYTDRLLGSVEKATEYAIDSQLANGTHNIPPQSNSLLIYPNPLYDDNEINILFELKEKSEFSIDVYDMMGKKVENIKSGNYHSGKYFLKHTLWNLAQGSYFIILKNKSDRKSFPIIITR
jgi:subtilisin family serine protease